MERPIKKYNATEGRYNEMVYTKKYSYSVYVAIWSAVNIP